MPKIIAQVHPALSVLRDTFTIYKLSPDASIPEEIRNCDFYNVSKSAEELSVVCPEQFEVQSTHSSPDWKCIKVKGPLDFDLTGILAGISAILAQANISIFAISTFNTDYILVPKQALDEACSVLMQAGYKFE